MRRTLAFILVLLCVSLSTSGCFDVEYAKELFLPGKETTPPPMDQYYHIDHQFVTVLNDPSSAKFTEVTPIPTWNETEYIDITLYIKIPELPDFENDTLREMLENITIDRYCNISIYDTNGTLQQSRFINQTTAHPIPMQRIIDPEPGEWKVKVDAQGIGFPGPDIHDEVHVTVTVHGPRPG